MKVKLIALGAAAVLMVTLAVKLTGTQYSAAYVIDYTTGDTVIPVTGATGAAAETSSLPGTAPLPAAADITMPAAIKVYDAARDAVFETETEEYIVGVVAAEMPSDFGTEALKAQAVAARSYMLYKMIHSPSSHRGGASVCTDHTCCKAYISYDDAVLRWSKEAADKVFATIRAAVEPVRGVILTYGGNVACALFHASSPGMTESAVNVWGRDLSYLRAVGTPETDEPETVFFKEAEFFGLLQAAGYAAAEGDVSVALNDTGRVGHVSVGDIKVPGTDMRNIFGLRSTCFTLDRTDGGYMFTVRGYGHGVGMSQRGAAEMAARGLSYDRILLHYYEGVTLCTVTISSQ